MTITDKLPTWADAVNSGAFVRARTYVMARGPDYPSHRSRPLASEVWTRTKISASGQPEIGRFHRIGPGPFTSAEEWNLVKKVEDFPVGRVVPGLALLLAACVSFFPLAPQQAKREAVIAGDPVHAPVELVSRQRAAEQAARWGFGS